MTTDNDNVRDNPEGLPVAETWRTETPSTGDRGSTAVSHGKISRYERETPHLASGAGCSGSQSSGHGWALEKAGFW